MHYLCGCGKLCIAVAFLAAAAGFGLAVDGLFAVAVHRDSYRFIDSLAYALDIEVTLIRKRIVAGIDKIEGVGDVVLTVVAAIDLIYIRRNIFSADFAAFKCIIIFNLNISARFSRDNSII